ncbi:MAG: sugar phosphate isomerase/epimerase family protein [Planctomycetota bacterium]
MLLGYVTNGLRDHRLDDALRLLAGHGYRAVGLTLDVGHLDPYRATPREVDAIAALCRELDLRVVIETGARFLLDPQHKHEPTLMSRSAADRARRIDFYARAAAIGRDLGAEVLSFWAGVDRAPDVDSRARLTEGVVRTCAAIRSAGLRPSFEPEPGMAIETIAQFDALCRELGGQAPALTLDVGHLFVTGEGDPVALCRANAHRCAQVHLEDMRRGVHEHLPPGEGEVDFRAVLSALAAGGHVGPVCFELSRSSHRAPELVERCATLFRQTGACS